MAISLAVIFSIFVGIGLLELNGPPSLLESLLDLGVLVLALVSLLALNRGLISPDRANLFVATIILAVFTNGFFCALLVNGDYTLKFVPYLIIGTGALMLSTTWLVATLIPIYALSLPLVWQLFPSMVLLELMIYYVMGTAICIAIHMVRKQAHLRIYALRREDTRTKAALKAALERSEKTFSDYTRTEEDRRSLEKQFHEAQKMEAVGVLAGGIAHGMNNLLGSISAYASVILDETRKDDPRRRETEEILMAAKRGGQLTRNLLGFARKGKFQKSIIDMNDIIRQTIDMLKPSLPMAVNVDIGLGPTIPPNYGDPSQMAQALMNLCLNAADAMPDGGDLYLTTSQAEIAKDAPSPLGALSPGRYSVIRVSDTGQGMDEETRSQAFDPFFTTKGPDKGTGLGLAMVYGTVQSHGGHVFIDSTPNRGTSVTMYLPAATDEQIATTPPRETAIPSVSGNGPKCVLLVDDEPMIRAAGRRILKRLRCDVLLASNGADAIEVFENAPHPIDLVILDVAMPVMDGAECFYKLRNIDPKLPIVISSGFADQAHTEKLIADGANGILPKPYDLNQMSKLIEMDSADEAATEGRESG